MKLPGLIIISTLLSITCWSQEVVTETVTSSGGTHVQPTFQIDWAIGEMVTESFLNGTFLLTQGTHQGYDALTLTVPVVETSEPIVIDINSATIGGNVISSGGTAVTNRGIYFGTEPEPITTGVNIPLGTGSGAFFTSLETLDPGTTYYVVAYATNSEGTAFGEEKNFCTITLPSVVSTNPDSITDVSALVGGEVICDGGLEINDRGLYWGISPFPEITGSKVEIGTGVGLFFQQLESLLPATTYFVKAYAVNSVGISYGDEVTFTTLSLPFVSTALATDVTDVLARVGGEVEFDGLAAITDRGIYFGTDPDPELSGTYVSMGEGIGEFSGIIENLSPLTVYYVKAYATNIIGTSLGDLVSFETLPSAGIPPLLWIDDMTVTSAQDTCFSASEIITVAGNGNFVDVNSGGSLLLVAGGAIRLLDGFRVFEGGNFQAWISINGEFCTNPKSMLAITEENTTHQQTLSSDTDGMNNFKVFPNPTSGTVMIEFSEMPESGVTVEIFSILGEVVYKTQVFGDIQCLVDLTDKPKGIYIFRVLMDGQFQIEKVIKK